MKNDLKNTASLDLEMNQTQFIEDSAFIEKTDPNVEVTPQKSKKWYVLIGLGVVVFLMIVSSLLMTFLKPKTVNPEDLTVQVTTEPKEIGPLERQLMILERDIGNADPLESALSFPPVNFELSLKDATTLLQP